MKIHLIEIDGEKVVQPPIFTGEVSNVPREGESVWLKERTYRVQGVLHSVEKNVVYVTVNYKKKTSINPFDGEIGKLFDDIFGGVFK